MNTIRNEYWVVVVVIIVVVVVVVLVIIKVVVVVAVAVVVVVRANLAANSLATTLNWSGSSTCMARPPNDGRGL